MVDLESLPDGLLLHILSFLKTYEAVRTSILSRRWKDLWKFVPCLVLDDLPFENNELFQNFVNRVLLLRKTKHLDMFRLSWYDKEQIGPIMDTWLRHIIELRPRVVRVNVIEANLLWFPKYLFSCGTLETLSLLLNVSERWDFNPKMVNLPVLKSLTLGFVVIDEGIMKGLLSACPLLEELELLLCSIETSIIASPTLKILTICGSYATALTIRTPSLVKLYCEAPLGLVSFESMPCLCTATIKLEGNDEVVKMHLSLLNAEELFIEGDENCIKEMLKKELHNNSCIFRNLKMLSFEVFNMSRNLQLIACFLHLTPNLVHLTFRNIRFRASTEEEEEDVQRIKCCHLETIEIDFDENCEDLIGFLKQYERI